ncbi:MAG TPA: GNAT family N-acyltransferase [Blastocatellia bacterium]|nr:GNAT family N-acyltransferase [Blastocatellia bacterium]
MENFERGRPAFGLNAQFDDSVRRRLFPLARRAIERLLLLPQLDEFYAEVAQRNQELDFMERILEALNVSYQLGKDDLARIPTKGSVIVVANHPFGIIDGVILASILRSVRSDYKILANVSLNRVTELCDTLIPVDPYGRQESIKANSRSIRKAVDWVRSGGALGVFPAGEVAHIHLRKREVTDPARHPSVARIIRRTGAPALPLYFEGSNGPLFHVAGMVHPRLRTVMLPHELLNKRDTAVKVGIGRLVPFSKLAAFETDGGMIECLRQRTYLLGNRRSGACYNEPPSGSTRKRKEQQPITPELPPALLAEEVFALPTEQRLVVSGSYAVVHADARQIPNVLREIGRLREITFREASEGTGKATDLDEFDAHYVHLFLWNRETSTLVGAYRIGKTDEILRRVGSRGLYTTSLFNYNSDLLERIGPALELGRSFVRREYQKLVAPLFLLWRGIVQYVLRNPRYKVLFGPVSIDSEYHPVARKLIVECLTGHRYTHELAALVRAKTPFRAKAIKGRGFRPGSALVADIEDVSELISDIDKHRRGIPVLLRQYLKLGGKVLGFNIDPGFSDALDGLILVDLTQTDGRLLGKLMGEEGKKRFLEFHRNQLLLAS